MCHNYFDLLSWASEPLKQRVHFLRSEDGVNLKELLGLWDTQQSWRHGPSETSTTIEQIHEFLLLCKSGSSDSFNETTFPVCQRQVETNLQQALVPLGRITPQEYLSVALVAEGTLDKQDPNWKYHGLVLSQEHQLVTEGWRVMTETTSVMSPPARPLTLHGYPFGPSPIYEKDQEQMDDDDDDDDYWQQYGEPEATSPSVTEPSSAPLGFRTTALSSIIEPEVDAEEEEYWRKYAEHQEEQPPQPSSTSKDSDQQSDDGDGDIMDSAYETYNSRSPSSFGSTEARRILVAASLDSRVEFTNCKTEIVPPNNNQLDDGLACPVDPTTLSMLLKQLADTTTTVGQENCHGRYYQDEDDNDEDRATVDFFVEEEDDDAEKSPEEFRPRAEDYSNNTAASCSRSVSSGTQSLSTSTSQNQEPMRQDQQPKDCDEKGKGDCYPQENENVASFPCQQSEPLHSPPTGATDDPASYSSSALSNIEDGIGMSLALDKSSESLIFPQLTTATNNTNIHNTTRPTTSTTLANITPLDSPPSRSPSCATRLEHPRARDSDSEISGTLCSDKVRILSALKVLVSEASSFGLDQQDLLCMLDECFSF